MSGIMNDIRLCELLQTIPPFSFFDELIDIPSYNTKLSQHELIKINKILDDIIIYLKEVIRIFNQIRKSNINLNNDLAWYYDGKDGILELDRNMISIDDIIGQLIMVVETGDHTNVARLLFTKFEQASELTLDVKKFVIMFKRNLEISINFKEIDNIIRQIIQETEDCLKIFFKLRESKLSSPKRVLPNLETIISKMKISDIFSVNNISVKSIRLPTFNETDELLYQGYLQLENRIQPLKISLDIIPLKIEEFNQLCSGNSFILSRQSLLIHHEKLHKRWIYLQNELEYLKRESLDSKWLEIFQYLVKQIISKCDLLESSLNDKQFNDELGYTYKLCSNSIILINKAFHESIIRDQLLIDQFNMDLLPKWETINRQLLGKSNSPQSSVIPSIVPSVQNNSAKLDSNGLRIFQTGRQRSVSPAPPNHSKTISSVESVGVNLGIDTIQTTGVPFSIHKEDRVRNFFSHSNVPPPISRNIRDSLLSINDLDVFQDVDYDDESTLVNKTPKFAHNFDNLHLEMEKLRIKSHKESIKEVRLEEPHILKTVEESPPKVKLQYTPKLKPKPSKIPKIIINYGDLGYPTIKKKFFSTYPKSLIPSISVSHPLFHSPERDQARSEAFANLERQPLTQLKKSQLNSTTLGSPTSSKRVVSGEILAESINVFRRPSKNAAATNIIGSRSRSSSMGSLHSMKIPNLSYVNSPPAQYNSTSPERPNSSLGSRFDDAHLLPSTKSLLTKKKI
ncbi:karyogamy protein [Scheffersomyces amazonensis]|uniref:karyogamy protein n=1 Tax=Scheffersomyces amazonensis TaxID=1078765 RepID=UPI00315CD848